MSQYRIIIILILKGEHWYNLIFDQVKSGLILSILAYLIFVEAKFKPTKKQKQSSDLYSLLLLYPAGGHSLFLLHPAGGNSLLLLYPAGGHSLFLLNPAGGNSSPYFTLQVDTAMLRREVSPKLFPPAG